MNNSMLSTENKAKLRRLKAKKKRRTERNELRKDVLSDILSFFGGSRSSSNNFIDSDAQQTLNELEAEGKKVVDEVKKNGLTKRQITGLAILTTAVVGALAYTFLKKK